MITEIGCGTPPIFLMNTSNFISFPKGAGNSVFPLLAANQNPDLHLHAYDYSSHAIKLVQVCSMGVRYVKGDTDTLSTE
jgi:hypothetical protein